MKKSSGGQIIESGKESLIFNRGIQPQHVEVKALPDSGILHNRLRDRIAQNPPCGDAFLLDIQVEFPCTRPAKNRILVNNQFDQYQCISCM